MDYLDNRDIETGRKIVIAIAMVKLVSSIIVFFIRYNVFSLILSIALVIALCCGVNWVRWFYVIAGGLGIVISAVQCIQLTGYADLLPSWFFPVMLLAYAIDISLIFIMFLNGKVNAFFDAKKEERFQEKYAGYETVRYSAPVYLNETKKIENTYPCPLCGEQIVRGQAFCQFCGGDVAAKENETKEERERQWKEKAGGDLGALFDVKTRKEADMYRRMYGKDTCISFLQDKAKEQGFDHVEITEDDLAFLTQQ